MKFNIRIHRANLRADTGQAETIVGRKAACKQVMKQIADRNSEEH
jgi:hypothetical protein